MKIIHLKNISAADLINPRNLFYLPMEVVLTSPQEALPVFPTVRAYRLPRDKYPPGRLEEKDPQGSYESWNDRYLLEVWGDYGDDGHTEQIFLEKFILLYETELPRSWGAYLAVLNMV